jgi:hypothetical protein
MQNCVDEKSILVVLEPTLLKICIVQGRTISPTLLVYNMMTQSTKEELQKKCKIALMRNPYRPFWNKSIQNYPWSRGNCGRLWEMKQKWVGAEKKVAYCILGTYTVQEH